MTEMSLVRNNFIKHLFTTILYKSTKPGFTFCVHCLQVSRPPYEVIREQYVLTHHEFTAVAEKFYDETQKHSTIMQVNEYWIASFYSASRGI